MSRGSNVAAHVVVIISHLFVPLALPKVLSLTIVFILRTSAIQTSLIALGLLSVRIYSNRFDLTVLETLTRHKKYELFCTRLIVSLVFRSLIRISETSFLRYSRSDLLK